MTRYEQRRPRSFDSQDTWRAVVCMGVSFVVVAVILGIVAWVAG